MPDNRHSKPHPVKVPTGQLASFRRRRADLLARGEPTGYSKTVAKTWSLAFGRLEQAEPGAVGLLRLLAFCAPEAVPLRLLLQPRPGLAGSLEAQVVPVLTRLLEDPLAVNDAVAVLGRYSLVSLAADGSVSVHRLVQAVTVDHMPADLAGHWRQAAAAVIEAAIPAHTDQPETWPVCTALLPHARVALSDHSDGLARIANYLGRRGSYAAARDLQLRILEARERVLDAEHPKLGRSVSGDDSRDRQPEPALRLMGQVGPEPARDAPGKVATMISSNRRLARTFSMASSGSELAKIALHGTPSA